MIDISKDVFNFFLGAVFGFMSSIGLVLFKYYYFRPKLKIKSVSIEKVEKFSCLSLRIFNLGKRPAKNAIGTITIENLKPDDILPDSQFKFTRDIHEGYEKFGLIKDEIVYLKKGLFREIELEPIAWSEIGNRSSITIYPQMSRLLDVCRFIRLSDHHQIQIPSSKSWQEILVVLKPQNYDITISVSADDGILVKKGFKLYYDGVDVALK